eukprot:gnl/Carplike_NY0171/8159_a11309_209.p1 GENE.gnl/Carplike_NY0171/8159_a11309_209~~gnl/Carplike_NY0171/8159_a11309_209.p1  ORF type:complete len:207 (+),score=-8.71 gnl/Carplike_NY0171/8159_a11309_209:110-730(+)
MNSQVRNISPLFITTSVSDFYNHFSALFLNMRSAQNIIVLVCNLPEKKDSALKDDKIFPSISILSHFVPVPLHTTVSDRFYLLASDIQPEINRKISNLLSTYNINSIITYSNQFKDPLKIFISKILLRYSSLFESIRVFLLCSPLSLFSRLRILFFRIILSMHQQSPHNTFLDFSSDLIPQIHQIPKENLISQQFKVSRWAVISEV